MHLSTSHPALHLPAALLLAALTLPLTACGSFFVCQKASCTDNGSTTGTGSGDYAYVSNSSSGDTYLNEFDLGSGTLTAISGSPTQLDFIPSAIAVTPDNTLVYIASAQSAVVYAYSIGTNGALTILNNGVAVADEAASSMDISPDGKYIFFLNSLTMDQYAITGTTGVLGSEVSTSSFANVGVNPVNSTASSVRVAPSGDFIVCALGQAGDVFFPYDETTGTVEGTDATLFTPALNTEGDYAVAIDVNNYTYIGRTNVGLLVYQVTPAGTPTLITSTSAYSTGNGPKSVVVSKSSNDVYVGNFADGTITGFTIGSNGALASVGSATAAPPDVLALGQDNSGKYVLSAGYSGTGGIELFSIGSSGALSPAGTAAASGTTIGIPTAMALTH